jgi:hypothetical protein
MIVEDDDVIQQVLAKGSHHAFHGSILPGATKGYLLGLDTHGFHKPISALMVSLQEILDTAKVGNGKG